MRYIRCKSGDQIIFAEVLAAGLLQPLDAAPYAGGKPVGATIDRTQVTLLAPCEPTKVVAIGKNYHDHIKEFDGQVPESPIIFIKANSSINNPDGVIELPPQSVSQRIDYEGELAVVIGRTASRVKAADALDHVFGYTILNDVTARDVQKSDGQWARAKSMDTFCPIGPEIVTGEFDPDRVGIRTRLNGEIVQESNTEMLIWKTAALIEFISETISLYPGDIIATGTPAGVGPMKDGDIVEVVIDGIGVLRNTVKAR
ncbi:MAG: fumarylacetoacetate hydrolase family protein [Ruminococcaceae bacterium]|nr:fumarylacetoacetate hydrolase family protein [Oscillospiraceae bacterium]